MQFVTGKRQPVALKLALIGHLRDVQRAVALSGQRTAVVERAAGHGQALRLQRAAVGQHRCRHCQPATAQ